MSILEPAEERGGGPGASAKTVVHMTSVHARPDDPRIFLKECRTLAAAGYAVHLIAPNAVDRLHMGVRLWGVKTPRRGGRLTRMTSTVLEVYRRARDLAADLYHFHDPELMPVGMMLARGGAAVVYDAHEDLVASIPDKPWIRPRLRPGVLRATARLEPAAADRLAAVVAATPVIEQRFAHCRCPVVTVNNYPQLAEFGDVRRREPEPGPAVCYVGGIDAARGIETLIEGIAKTDAGLLLAGTAEPASFGDHLRTLPGWSQVVNFGQVDRARVAEIFGRAVAGVVILRPLSRYVVSQPTKLFEYMAAGLPVIASDFPLWREIVEPNSCGICVDPLNADAVAEAIRWVVAHPREARDMGENGRRAVKRTYNWEVEGRKLTALYAQILGR